MDVESLVAFSIPSNAAQRCMAAESSASAVAMRASPCSRAGFCPSHSIAGESDESYL